MSVVNASIFFFQKTFTLILRKRDINCANRLSNKLVPELRIVFLMRNTSYHKNGWKMEKRKQNKICWKIGKKRNKKIRLKYKMKVQFHGSKTKERQRNNPTSLHKSLQSAQLPFPMIRLIRRKLPRSKH